MTSVAYLFSFGTALTRETKILRGTVMINDRYTLRRGRWTDSWRGFKLDCQRWLELWLFGAQANVCMGNLGERGKSPSLGSMRRLVLNIVMAEKDNENVLPAHLDVARVLAL